MNSCGGQDAFFVWLASSLIPAEVLRSLPGEYADISSFHSSFMRKDPKAVSFIPARYQSSLWKNGSLLQLSHFHKMLEGGNISILTSLDNSYPPGLIQIPNPPAVLFYQGEIRCLNQRSLAFVGSRAASYAGQKATRSISKKLSGHGICIISGMAYGIDTSAHLGCLEGGSPTIAVMGCGLDRTYPSGQVKLREEILRKGGLLVSEFIPGEKPAGWHFPLRNRIITGLSSALVLMEARIKSGSLTSVHHALDQGKDVFVYPGDPSSEYFEGNHLLLREGARYFTCAENILEDMGWLDNQTIVGQNIDCSSGYPPVSPSEEAILRVLKPGMLSFEQLSDMTNLSPAELLSSITMLQVKGLIDSLPGKFYQIK